MESKIRYVAKLDADVPDIDTAVWGVLDTETGQFVVHFESRVTAQRQADMRNAQEC